MTKERVAVFISDVIKFPPPQVVEDVASESHETRRQPDPYAFLVSDGLLKTPSGYPVENYMEKESYLGKTEFVAFKNIQEWANENDEGLAIWFSPPYPGAYLVSKIIISEIFHSLDGAKSLFNRAIVLDINAEWLMNLSNQLALCDEFNDPEVLRMSPLFPDQHQFEHWFDILSGITPQSELVSSGEDVLIKKQTYEKISGIYHSAHTYEANISYVQLYNESLEQDMIGRFQGSCAGTIDNANTPFETMFEKSHLIGESNILKCTCPFCKKKVDAVISGGKIICPECSKSSSYKC